MNSKKDEPGKKETQGSSGPGESRPHATLDLKATEVPSKDPKADKGPAKDAGAAKDSGDAKPAARPASAGSRPAAAGTAPSKSGPATDKPSAKMDTKPDEAPAATGGRGGFFTHLAAGIAGGIIALVAADLLAPQLGLTGDGERSGATAGLQQRIAALEAESKKPTASPELAARLQEAEAKIGKLEEVDASVSRLAQDQNALSENVRALDDKVAVDTAAQERLAKLEKQLETMTAAVEGDPDGGGLPQLAVISGKVTDLESTMTNQLDALRSSVSEEIDTQLQAAKETSEAAKSGTQRIDRELSGIKADTAQLSTRLNTIGAESERALTDLRSMQEEVTRLKVDLNARLPTFARPEDISTALKPVDDKLAKLQGDLQDVVKSENERKSTASRIVLSLELANLKRAIDRGNGYAPELAQARKLAQGSLELDPLARFANTGVPTLAELRQDFNPVAFKIIDAQQTPADASIVDRLLAGAKSVVRVRKVSHDESDKSVEAVVARMETALAEDRLQDVLDEAKTLPQPSREVAQPFLAKVEARHAVDQALSNVEQQLKTSLVEPVGTDASAQE
jgi:hypothetical protein